MPPRRRRVALRSESEIPLPGLRVLIEIKFGGGRTCVYAEDASAAMFGEAVNDMLRPRGK